MNPRTGHDDPWRTANPLKRPAAERPYKIRRTIAGWQVTVRRSGGYTFTTSLAEAVEAVAAYELARLAAFAWTVHHAPGGGLYLVRTWNGETKHFHSTEAAAIFLAALNTKKATR